MLCVLRAFRPDTWTRMPPPRTRVPRLYRPRLSRHDSVAKERRQRPPAGPAIPAPAACFPLFNWPF